MEHNSKLTEYHIFSDSEYKSLMKYYQTDIKKFYNLWDDIVTSDRKMTLFDKTAHKKLEYASYLEGLFKYNARIINGDKSVSRDTIETSLFWINKLCNDNFAPCQVRDILKPVGKRLEEHRLYTVVKVERNKLATYEQGNLETVK